MDFETQSSIKVRRKFRIHFSTTNGRDVPRERAIKSWNSMLLKTGYFSSPTERGRKTVEKDINEEKEISADRQKKEE